MLAFASSFCEGRVFKGTIPGTRLNLTAAPAPEYFASDLFHVGGRYWSIYSIVSKYDSELADDLCCVKVISIGVLGQIYVGITKGRFYVSRPLTPAILQKRELKINPRKPTWKSEAPQKSVVCRIECCWPHEMKQEKADSKEQEHLARFTTLHR